MMEAAPALRVRVGDGPTVSPDVWFAHARDAQ